MKDAGSTTLFGKVAAATLGALLSFPLQAETLNNNEPATTTASEVTAGAVSENPSDVSKVLEQMLAGGTLDLSGVTLDAGDYRPIYGALSYQPLWVDASGLTPRALKVLAAIESSDEDGLPSALYSTTSIRALQNTYAASQHDVRVLATLDLLISHAVVTYAHDVRYGATPPTRKLLGGFKPFSDEAMRSLQATYTSDDPGTFLKAQSPQTAGYVGLKKVLADYRSIAAQGGWKAWRIGRVIHPGSRDDRLPDLRAVLAAMGDWNGDLTSSQYDATLKPAVLRFQSRHGLNPTGILSPATQKALAVPVEERLREIAATMERMRWMPEEPAAKYILVNLPAYELHAYEGGKEAFSMRVIVGKPATRTPQFSDVINEVIFNPTWSPTDSIVRKEMIPKLRDNPDYFIRANFTITQTGEPVDPHSVNFDEGDIHFRQSAGDGNALGKIKFNLPDTDDIYMHSTANPELFAKEERSLSHGCVRLEKPRTLAHFVMDGLDTWNADKVDDRYDSDETRHVRVSPVHVHFVYWTAWVDAEGLPHFYSDVYHHDSALIARLSPKEKAQVSVAQR